MSLNISDVKKLCRLSKIDIDDDSLDDVHKSISNILDLIDCTLNVECNTEDALHVDTNVTQHFREDVAVDGASYNELFCNLADNDRKKSMKTGYYHVPKVIDVG
ncbi:Asp-tRNA(Asn)/Glu-tRNA(Gln) amidotransferase subunit GatC [Candidatus Sneabacter namystus]|uniref:Glutamyl-tRNA(Gln) amidotransferase subunit C n=1 Tax=Candidatus Sneabacter namystus TaxID=2601646 RepID=A0A5C0UHR5_9RICK|nr:hypothetical protein [Candidatus Sneabacter namystus]QEK39576.1 hypothetical protein FZC37_01320 [Candidatus Sneabacter namystus]